MPTASRRVVCSFAAAQLVRMGAARASAPNGQAQQGLLQAAHTASCISSAELTRAEAHGTGTALGDPIETGSMRAAVLASRPKAVDMLHMTSVKANVGHTEPSAGAATGMVSLLLSLGTYCSPNAQLRVLIRTCSARCTQRRVPSGAVVVRRRRYESNGWCQLLWLQRLNSPCCPSWRAFQPVQGASPICYAPAQIVRVASPVVERGASSNDPICFFTTSWTPSQSADVKSAAADLAVLLSSSLTAAGRSDKRLNSVSSVFILSRGFVCCLSVASRFSGYCTAHPSNAAS